MASVALWIAVMALLCVAAAVMLWRGASVREQRARAARFVDSRLEPADARAPGFVATPPRAARSSARSAPNEPATGFARWRERASERWRNFSHRAGLAQTRGPLAVLAALTLTGALAAGVAGGAIAAGAALAGGATVIALWLVTRMQSRQRAIVRQLPSFLDGLVRLVALGNSVPAAFQYALQTTDAPLRACLDQVSRMLRTGVEIDRAMQTIADQYRIREFELVGSVLRLSVRYGGRADLMLERMAAFMRDLEQAERELAAMSAETRLSAWVLGLLPVGLACFMVAANPRYFAQMWGTPSGRDTMYAALLLQIVGSVWLHRLARLR